MILNGDLGICILITKMFVFLEIDQKLPNTCSLFSLYQFQFTFGCFPPGLSGRVGLVS